MSEEKEVKELRLVIRDDEMDMEQGDLSYVEILGLLDLARIRVERNLKKFWDNDEEGKEWI